MKIHRSPTGIALALVLTVLSIAALADTRAHGGPHQAQPEHNQFFDRRFDHDRYYPPRGYVAHELPRGHSGIRYRGAPYYVHGGVWYRPRGSRFVVVTPPIGAVVPLLPSFYTTIWIGGVPYYYANDAYYVWQPSARGYVVTRPPRDAETAARATGSDELYAYPTKGQSAQQQATDRYECHRWAADQTGYDPTQPLGGVGESSAASKRADYQRAQAACLQARGYSVK